MKKLLFTCLAITVIFATCKKEEEPPTSNNNNNPPTTYAFSCKIERNNNVADFTDNNPVATIVMRDAFPTSISSLDYSQQDTDTNYVQCNVSFAYPFYTIKAV